MLELNARGIAFCEEADLDLGLQRGVVLPVVADLPGQDQPVRRIGGATALEKSSAGLCLLFTQSRARAIFRDHACLTIAWAGKVAA